MAHGDWASRRVVDRVALLQGGEQGEELEAGTGLAGALGDDVVVGVLDPGPADHGQHLAGGRDRW